MSDEFEEIVKKYRDGAIYAAGRGHDTVPVNIVVRHIDEMADEIRSALVERKAELVPAAWREAVQEFVDRVERGEVRSKRTYAKFKELLAALSASPSPVDSRDGLEAATVKALENARTQILSAYRVWVADDIEAFPPPKTQAGEVIAQIDTILAAKEQQP